MEALEIICSNNVILQAKRPKLIELSNLVQVHNTGVQDRKNGFK
jgi:hypothetical protein